MKVVEVFVIVDVDIIVVKSIVEVIVTLIEVLAVK